MQATTPDLVTMYVTDHGGAAPRSLDVLPPRMQRPAQSAEPAREPHGSSQTGGQAAELARLREAIAERDRHLQAAQAELKASAWGGRQR